MSRNPLPLSLHPDAHPDWSYPACHPEARSCQTLQNSLHQIDLLLADGFEEIEALTVVDILRRASVYVDTVSITDEYKVRGSHGI